MKVVSLDGGKHDVEEKVKNGVGTKKRRHEKNVVEVELGKHEGGGYVGLPERQEVQVEKSEANDEKQRHKAIIPILGLLTRQNFQVQTSVLVTLKNGAINGVPLN